MEHYARLSGEKSLCSRSFSFFNNKASSESSAGQGTSTDEEVANDDGTNIEFDIDKHISAVLAGVGLTKEKDTIVGGVFQRGLSGGQKRRLSVSLEALSNPLNLFLDEPTVRIYCTVVYCTNSNNMSVELSFYFFPLVSPHLSSFTVIFVRFILMFLSIVNISPVLVRFIINSSCHLIFTII